ncbi:MAG: 3-keto-disaccharide hydrolase, partial [Ginsengibacter sp.]
VALNGTLVNACDMSHFTSAKTNPDGSEVPSWLSNPMATLPLHGHIGFKGKHAGAPIYFKNIKVKRLG